jgi:signal peptidase I
MPNETRTYGLKGYKSLAKTIRRLWKNEYFQTAFVLILIALVVVGLWFGSQLVMNTKIPPALAVISGSMCVPYGYMCNDWLSISHPFERTLHKGDWIIIQGVDAHSLNADYPNSDIIVYQDPRYPNDPNEKIVHRIIAKTEINGTLYFYTKGDGNGCNKWPNNSTEYDPWSPVPENMIYGKVVMRIPWLGYLPYIVQNMSRDIGINISYVIMPIIIIIIILLVIMDFIRPMLKQKPTEANINKEST